MLPLPLLLLLPAYILFLFLFPFPTSSSSSSSPFSNSSSHLHPLPDPESVVLELQRKLDSSRRRALSSSSCITGNPIDDCWLCSSSNWRTDRQRLADCGIGFGRAAAGGKGGPIYVVTSSADADPVNPVPGTLRHAVIQEGPLWIVFSSSMTIRLSEELLMNNFKTLDGRGADVHIAGGACITIQYVSHVIIHNIHIHGCRPAGNANVRATPTHSGWRTKSDGDGISLYGARDVWIDHCSISECADGLVDAIMGSTGITISNNYFANHDDVMLMGHSDDYLPDSAMQVTIAFNRFGEGLVQRMPRCRRGYFHIVNNDYTYWEMYAIGGSANPTINSQGNRYSAPSDRNAKEVTKRVDAKEGEWDGWNWISDGDVMLNGAFFVPSGDGLEAKYTKASSVDPKSESLVEQITQNAGVIGGPRDNGDADGNSGGSSMTTGGDGEGSSKGGGVGFGYLGMVFASGAELPPSQCYSSLLFAITLVTALFSLLCVHPS